MNDSLTPMPVRPSSYLGRLIAGWDWFWFSKADPLPLGVIRFFTGLVIFYIHLAYTPQLFNLMGPDAWIDHSTISRLRHTTAFVPGASDWDRASDYNAESPYARGYLIFSVWFHVTDPAWMMTVHVLFLIAMAMFCLGLCTRLTGVVTWMAMMSYIQRAPTALFGMDTVTNVMMIYMILGPSGAAFSLDRLLTRWWARRQGLPAPEVEPRVSANFALRLMQLHFCIIYTASGLSKLQGSAWWNGTAMWGTFAHYEFSPMNWPFYQDFLIWLCQHRWLWEILGATVSIFTIALEVGFVFLIWQRRTRWLMIAGAVALHVGIGLIMGLTTFSLTMLCLVLCFVPAETMHGFLARLRFPTGGLASSPRAQPRPEPEPLLT